MFEKPVKDPSKHSIRGVNKLINDEKSLRSLIVKWGKELYDAGMVKGSGGNISVKYGNTILLTPTGYFLGHLNEDDISLTDAQGNLISGPKSSKETPMHVAAYKASPEIKAVIHVHAPYSVALASTFPPNSYMPIYLPSVAIKVGNIKITPFEYPGSEQLANVVYESLKVSPAVLLANHGIVATGKNIEEALSIAYEIEENAHLYYITNGNIKPLSVEILTKLLKVYK